ncbi:N-acetylmuramoyl-L-alanine amidase [Parabacteroides pacaensis]|uniref:N-acetylmuramoyl-L-alanine amidase n=1 Tax=Parabacteroides pacaensis TaxID=2086575 RepID=UPI000D10FC0D|nr:N-acetylmuramoyl-L-alanine amidase [Parabacteroides pacaensis]
MKVLIDNGHGENTSGKRSPDGKLREYAYCREIADRVVVELRKQGIEAERIVKEEIDVPLSERCRRANELYHDAGRQVVLVSIHCNAAGSGKEWMDAHGWSVFVSNNASYNSRKLASCLAQAADKIGVTVRRPAPGQDFWVQNLAICRDTLCPAVLVENFFQDNREDVDFLLSEEGKKCVTGIMVEGIINYIGV